MTNEIMSTDQPTPLAQMQRAKAIAKEIASTVGHLIVNIQGRSYPTVAWWQAVGWAFNVTSTEVEVVKQATEDGSTEYMAVVAIVRIDTGETVSRGSAIASSAERAPWGRSARSWVGANLCWFPRWPDCSRTIAAQPTKTPSTPTTPRRPAWTRSFWRP